MNGMGARRSRYPVHPVILSEFRLLASWVPCSSSSLCRLLREGEPSHAGSQLRRGDGRLVLRGPETQPGLRGLNRIERKERRDRVRPFVVVSNTWLRFLSLFFAVRALTGEAPVPHPDESRRVGLGPRFPGCSPGGIRRRSPVYPARLCAPQTGPTVFTGRFPPQANWCKCDSHGILFNGVTVSW